MRSLAVVLALLAFPATAISQTVPRVVRGLSFSGNKAIDDLTLAANIATTNSSWFARSFFVSRLGFGTTRTLNENDLKADVRRIRTLYRYSGYMAVRVDTLVVRSEDEVRITFNIIEGEPVRLTEFELLGIAAIPEREFIERDLGLKPGDVFSRLRLEEVVDTLTARLNNRGYPSGVVVASWESDTVSLEASAQIRITPGLRAVFGPLRVSGAVDVDTSFIRSLIPARPGLPFRLELLHHAQRILYDTELFRYATVGIDTALFAVGDVVVPLVVDVIEGPDHGASGSVGFGTTDCFRAGAGWTARNFLGSGRVVSFSGRLSKIGVGEPLGFGAQRSICSPLETDTIGSREVNYTAEARVRRYGFLAPDNILSLSLFAERRSEFKVYQREEVGAALSVTRETARRIPVTLSYRLAYGSTDANPVAFCQFFNACISEDIDRLGESRISSQLSLGVTRRRVNNILDPSRGTILSAEATISSSLLGSSELEQFTRLVADATVFIPLNRSVVLAGHIGGGLIFAPEVDLAGGRANFVPPEQRFYAGGPNDVRGYDRNELGPVVYVVSSSDTTDALSPPFDPSDTRVAATGGDRIAVANLELRLPSPIFSRRLRFVTFLDAGALWSGRGTGQLRFTPGLGARFASPVGPVRFDFGFNSYRLESGPVFTNSEDGDLVQIVDNYTRDRRQDWTIHFSIGHAF